MNWLYSRLARFVRAPDRGNAGSTPRDVLLFHYYGGLLFCGAEDWAQAAGFFKTVRRGGEGAPGRV